MVKKSKAKKILTPQEWLNENFFEQDRPKSPITIMVMEQYANYILKHEKDNPNNIG